GAVGIEKRDLTALGAEQDEILIEELDRAHVAGRQFCGESDLIPPGRENVVRPILHGVSPKRDCNQLVSWYHEARSAHKSNPDARRSPTTFVAAGARAAIVIP